jgi:hypothetical protein
MAADLEGNGHYSLSALRFGRRQGSLDNILGCR